MLPATDAVDFQFTGSIDGGSTYLAGTNYDFTGAGRSTAGANSNSNVAASSVIVLNSSDALGNATNEHYTGSIELFSPDSGNHKTVVFNAGYKDGSGNFIRFSGAGRILTTSAVDAVKFAMSSGNIASGEIKVYGVK